MTPSLSEDVKQIREAMDGSDGEAALKRILARLTVVDKALDAAREAGDALAYAVDSARRNAYSNQSIKALETELDSYDVAEDS